MAPYPANRGRRERARAGAAHDGLRDAISSRLPHATSAVTDHLRSSSRVRLLTLDDAEAWAAIVTASRESHRQWDPVRQDAYFTVDSQRGLLAAALAAYAEGTTVPLAILDADGRLAGRLTLSGITRGAWQSAAVGYVVSHDRWGLGLATAAVAEALALAFGPLGLHRVQAETLEHNAASQRVLTRNGFQRFGLAPRYLHIDGRWQDHLLFQRLADDEG